MVEFLKEIMNRKDLRNIRVDPRPMDIHHIYADITKAKRILGFDPQVSLKEGLIKLVNWHTKNRHFRVRYQ